MILMQGEITSIIIGFISLFIVVAMYRSNKMIHAALFLSLVFFINALVFLLLSQPILAILQLMIMVGGIATYIFVSVAPAKNSIAKVRYGVLVLLFIILFVNLALPMLLKGYINNAGLNYSFGLNNMIYYISANIGLFYLMGIMLFTTALAAIILMKMPGVLS